MPTGVEVKAEGLVEAITLFNGARARWQKRLLKTGTEFGEYAAAYAQKRFRTGGTEPVLPVIDRAGKVA